MSEQRKPPSGAVGERDPGQPVHSEVAGRLARWREQTLAPGGRPPKLGPAYYRAPDSRPPRDLDVPPPDPGTRYLERVGFPGEYPYTRGVHATMYRARPWTMRQYAGFGTAAESNRRYRYLLEQGTTGLSVAFDLPTQMGHDSDSARAVGEVGKVGVAICSIHDMETLFEAIPLDRVSTSMTINATASTLLAFYIAVAERHGVPAKALRGTIQNDILKEYIARGTYIYPPRPSMRIITDVFAFCSEHVPQWNTVSVSGYHIREAGSTAAQEVGFTLADGIAYVEAALQAGLKVDDFAPRISFFFNVHNDFLEEVAKFRAARRLWARIMRERFGAADPRSLMLRFHTQTAGSTLTAQQPDVNIVRVTLQAMAAVLGGTQSLHTNAKDEALALPSEEAARIALRTQQVIAFESGVTDHVDPLAGSYVVESFTDAIEAEAMNYIQRIDDLGGAVAAIEHGYQQDLIQDAAYEYQKAVEEKRAIVVGVNRFGLADEASPRELLRIDARTQQEQIDRLRALRQSRPQEPVRSQLEALTAAARGSDNLMPRILDCVRSEVTLGEIADALRGVFGEYR